MPLGPQSLVSGPHKKDEKQRNEMPPHCVSYLDEYVERKQSLNNGSYTRSIYGGLILHNLPKTTD